MKTILAIGIFTLCLFQSAWTQRSAQGGLPTASRNNEYTGRKMPAMSQGGLNVPYYYLSEADWQKATRATLLHANDKQVPRLLGHKSDESSVIPLDSATLACAVEVHDDGTVTARWGDGSSYSGEVYFGEIRGKGTMIYPDGSRYEGEWEADLPNGEGIFTDSTGTAYAVRWIDGLPHGKGSIVQPDGTRYAARWRNGKLRPKSVKSFEPQPSFEP